MKDDQLERTFVTNVSGRGVAARPGRLRIVEGPDAPRELRIPAAGVVIGSAPDAMLCLTDRRVSRNHAQIVPEGTSFRVRDLGSSNGTFLAGARIEDALVPPGSAIIIGKTTITVVAAEEHVQPPASTRTSFGGLVGGSRPMREVYAVLEVAARADASVLLEGETGTGKEVVARALHSESKRAKGPFVVIDCGAIPAELAESELFGHMRGSFTGATDTRPGAFERAHGGTLLLDELGELPIDLQPKLLRALESREIRKIGGTEVKKVDVRVIAATNRDLQERIEEGEFRSDLFYRLAVIMVQLPSLRERLEDLPVLVQRMLRDMGLADPGPILGPNLEHLQQHRWPGNVRELRNVLERAVAGVGREEGRFTDLSIHVGSMRASSMRPSGVPNVDLSLSFQVGKERHNDAFELAYLTQLLSETKGNVAEASRRAQLSRRHLYDLLKKHGLKA